MTCTVYNIIQPGTHYFFCSYSHEESRKPIIVKKNLAQFIIASKMVGPDVYAYH